MGKALSKTQIEAVQSKLNTALNEYLNSITLNSTTVQELFGGYCMNQIDKLTDKELRKCIMWDKAYLRPKLELDNLSSEAFLESMGFVSLRHHPRCTFFDLVTKENAEKYKKIQKKAEDIRFNLVMGSDEATYQVTMFLAALEDLYETA